MCSGYSVVVGACLYGQQTSYQYYLMALLLAMFILVEGMGALGCVHIWQVHHVILLSCKEYWLSVVCLGNNA